MAYQLRAVEDTDTIKSEGYSVRVAVDGGKTLFACKDILTLCGYKCTSDIARKMAEDSSYPGTTKLIAYPVVGERGMRRIQMYFSDERAVRTAINYSNISPDARKWLEESVLTYRKKPVPVERTQDEPLSIGEREGHTEFDYDRMNTVVDRILIELMEIKKNLLAIAK